MRVTNRVSIILPVYNCEKYLEETLTSIINQTYLNWELIIINDGSTDQSLKICNYFKEKDKRVYIINQENKGVSVARNVGLSKTKGEYIVFLDGDDIIKNDYLEKMINYIKMYNVDICICSYTTIKNHISFSNQFRIENGVYSSTTQFLFQNDIFGGYCWNKMYKFTILEGIVFNKKLSIMEDLVFNIDIWEKDPLVYYTNEPLYNYYVRSNSATNSKGIKEIFFPLDIIIKREEDKFPLIMEKFKVIYVCDYYRIKALNPYYKNTNVDKNVSHYLKDIKRMDIKSKFKFIFYKNFPLIYRIIKKERDEYIK